MARSTSLAGIASLVLVAALAGCATPAPEPAVEPPHSVRAIDPEIAAALIEGHNSRVAMLRQVHASGVLEFRWVDEEGAEHFEPQVNAKLWIRAPRDTALRAEKLGEVLFWVGSDAERYWLFDFVSDERGLHVGRHEEAPSEGGEGLLLVRPLALLDLLGLTPIAESGATVTSRGAGDPWQVTAPGAGGPMRIFFSPSTRLPERVESLNADGSVALASTLRRYASVDVSGVAVAARPRLATLIDIADPEETISVKLALDAPDDETRDRLFDLDTLRQHLQ